MSHNRNNLKKTLPYHIDDVGVQLYERGIAPEDVTVRWTTQSNMALTLADGSRLTVLGQANYWATAGAADPAWRGVPRPGD